MDPFNASKRQLVDSLMRANLHQGELSDLMIACYDGNVDVVTTFLRQANIKSNRTGFTALHYAVFRNHLPIIRVLIANGANVNDRSNDGLSIMEIACIEGNVDALRLLLKNGANKSVKDNQGISCLGYAIMNNQVQIVECLLQHGMDPNEVQTENRWTPACLAAVENNVDILNLLQNYNANFSLKSNEGGDPFLIACANGSLDAVKFLVKQSDVNLYTMNMRGRFGLDYACSMGNIQMRNYLLVEAGYDVNRMIPDDGFVNSFMWACGFCNKDTLLQFLTCGADVEFESRNGSTPLSCAIDVRNFQNAFWLVSYHSHLVGYINKFNVTPIEYYINQCKFKNENFDVNWIHLLLDSFIETNPLNQDNSLAWYRFLKSDCNLRCTILQQYIETFINQVEMTKQIAYLYYDGHNCIDITDKATRNYMISNIYFCGRYELDYGPPIHISATSIVVKAKDHHHDDILQTAYQSGLEGDNTRMELTYNGYEIAKSYIENKLKINLPVQMHLTEDEFKRKFSTRRCNQSEFIHHCTTAFGHIDAVVIKFMSSKEQYHREVHKHKELKDSPYIIRLVNYADDDSITTKWKKEVVNLDIFKERSQKEYEYGIIMVAGDRDLMTIYNYEYPTIDQIRTMMSQLLIALRELHNKNIMHGDIKMLNVIRYNNHMHILDLDAAATIQGSTGNSAAGSKFSSGYLPPEMIYEFVDHQEVDTYMNYWKQVEYESQSIKNAWLEKITPKESMGRYYGIKSFKNDSHDQAIITNLPYSLVPASTKMDIWSLGMILFQLGSRRPLIALNRDDDMVSGDDFRYIYTINETMLNQELMSIKDSSLRHMISCMLQFNPQHRWNCGQLLNHPFITNEITDNHHIYKAIQHQSTTLSRIEQSIAIIKEKSIRIENMSLLLRGELSRSIHELKKFIRMSNDVSVPTLFIISPKLSVEERRALEAEGNSSNVNIKIMKKTKEFFTKTKEFFDRIREFDFKSEFLNLFRDKYEICLLCQLCYNRMESEGIWPVTLKLTKTSVLKSINQILPLAEACFNVIKILNTSAIVVRALGYPVPTLPLDSVDINLLSARSSVHQYRELEQRLIDAREQHLSSKNLNADSSNPVIGDVERLFDYSISSSTIASSSSTTTDPHIIDGYSQRQFQQYLSEIDPKNDWGKLRRIYLDDGHVLWCCESCCNILKEHHDMSYEEIRALVQSPVIDALSSSSNDLSNDDDDDDDDDDDSKLIPNNTSSTITPSTNTSIGDKNPKQSRVQPLDVNTIHITETKDDRDNNIYAKESQTVYADNANTESIASEIDDINIFSSDSIKPIHTQSNIVTLSTVQSLIHELESKMDNKLGMITNILDEMCRKL